MAKLDASSDAPSTSKKASLLNPHATLDPAASLPTPSKTPSKKHAPNRASISSTSRVLFLNRPSTVDEAMPTPRKNKYTRRLGGLDGSSDDPEGDAADKIEIFTDSVDRVPTKDDHEDNPFVARDEQEPVEQPKRSSTKRRRGQSSSDQRMDERVKNGEGLIYVLYVQSSPNANLRLQETNQVI
jgi:hypothetical protein